MRGANYIARNGGPQPIRCRLPASATPGAHRRIPKPCRSSSTAPNAISAACHHQCRASAAATGHAGLALLAKRPAQPATPTNSTAAPPYAPSRSSLFRTVPMKRRARAQGCSVRAIVNAARSAIDITIFDKYTSEIRAITNRFISNNSI